MSIFFIQYVTLIIMGANMSFTMVLDLIIEVLKCVEIIIAFIQIIKKIKKRNNKRRK